MKFILASHGDFAKGLLSSINMLLGPQENIEAYGLYPEEEPLRLYEKLEAALTPEDEGNVVFFTDLYFGSPFNRVVELARVHDIYHITGTNLPALLEATMTRNGGGSIEEVCEAAIQGAEGSVKDVRKLLAAEETANEEEEEW